MSLSIISNDERRKAVVTESPLGGSVITYFRSTEGTHGSGWRFDREAHAMSPFHEALNIATRIVNHAGREGGCDDHRRWRNS